MEWSEEFCGGAWVIRSYADVAAALRDPRFSVRRAARWINSTVAPSMGGLSRTTRDSGLDQFKRVFSRSLLFVDGRAHRRLRTIVNIGFKPNDLQSLAPAIAGIAEELISALCAKATASGDGRRHVAFDFVESFARPLPALVIARMMGVTSSQPAGFVGWAADLAAFIGSPTPTAEQVWRAQEALACMTAFFQDEMAARADTPGDDLLGRIMLAQQEHRLSRVEALAQCCTLLFAGYETTRNLLGNGLLALLRHPEQWARLKASPQLLRNAIREMLRYDSPVQYTGRRLVADIELRGKTLRKGELAILHIGAANYDPERFTDPHRFDIARDEGNHLAFGHGPHVCIGAALTCMEAEIAFGALLSAMPDMALSPAGLAWQNNSAYSALERLSLTCHLPSMSPRQATYESIH
ncbi:cytochrome P450 [Herbaspirillum chlorophenolicum]|uniref:Cytochrome P450 n=1 Tax=Herbaspirillum chlorophenolicum TaxID=211589 RepID=A0ABW8F098_9BURK